MAGTAAASKLPDSPWRQLILAVACLLAVLPGIFTLPPVDRDESRYVQATRQMLDTGEYVDIRFQDEHRYKKPVGIYWLQSLTVKMTGQGADAPVWAFRLASSLGAVVAVLAISGLGGYLFGPLAAWGAGIMLVGLFGLGFEARMAKTDAVLLAATLIAQSALARFYVGSRRGETVGRGWWWTFWLAVGAGLLVKGPITPMIVALTCLALAVFDRGDRAWLRQFRPLRGLLVLVLVALPWFIAITWRSGLDFWAESVGKDLLSKVASGQESHGFPPGYYTLTYSLYMWPFGLLALVGGLKVINRFRDPRCLFLLAWYVPFWLVFELTPTKLPHYMLPAYPAIILAGAWAFVTEEGRAVELRRWQVWLMWLGAFGLFAVTLGFAAISLAGGPLLMDGQIVWWGVPAALLALLAGWLATGWGAPRRPIVRLALAAAMAAAFTGVFTGRVVPAFTPMWLSPTIAQAFKANRPCPTSRLASVGYIEPSLVVLAGTETELTDLEGAAHNLAQADGCGIALVPEANREDIEAMMPEGTRLEAVATISGINYSKGDELDLVMLRPAR
jgi:4-amino-4-deoxy-L-arabinose transferase-like glycosyltransferase